MTISEVNEYADSIDEEIIVFENPSFNNSIVGISYDNRVIYDYELMIEDLMKQDNLSYEDAVEFIDYNTLGSLGCCENGPIILYTKSFNY